MKPARDQDLLTRLRHSELLREAPDCLLEALLARATERRMSPGEILFREGDTGDSVYLVLEGELLIESGDLVLLTRRMGQWVGEIALIDDRPRSAGARASASARLLGWRKQAFQSLIKDHGEFALLMFHMLARKLRQTVEREADLLLEQKQVREDLRRAREVQASLLPAGTAQVGGMEIAGYCQPTAEVGGDYFDYVRLGDDRVAMVLADVAGHGFDAALLAAMVKSAFNNLVRTEADPVAVLEVLARTLRLAPGRNSMMSCFYGLFDAAAGTLRYANAGHPAALHYVAATAETRSLGALSTLLGLEDLVAGGFREEQVPWRAGDVLLCFSDGISECRSKAGEPFGEQRLTAILNRHAKEPAARLLENTLEAARLHHGRNSFPDDLTLLVARTGIS